MRSKMLCMAAGLMVAGAVFCLSDAAASDSELLVTESAVPVAEQAVDVEIGMTYTKAKEGKRGVWDNSWSRTRREKYRMYEWELAATIGVAPDVDLGISTGFVAMKDLAFGNQYDWSRKGHGRGMDDLRVNARWRFYEEGGLSLAYIPGLTIPTGRHTNIDRERFGPGQHYWSIDQRLAATQEMDPVVLSADVGYSLPLGRTRRGWERDWGMHTDWNARRDSTRRPREQGVLDANVGMVYTELPVRPVLEVNYAHRWINRGNDSTQIHATVGCIVAVDENAPRVKVGYQHPIAGRNAARTRKFMLSLSMVHAF